MHGCVPAYHILLGVMPKIRLFVIKTKPSVLTALFSVSRIQNPRFELYACVVKVHYLHKKCKNVSYGRFPLLIQRCSGFVRWQCATGRDVMQSRHTRHKFTIYV